MVDADRIAHNLAAVRVRIAAAAKRAGRTADSVTLIAVTKGQSPGVIPILAALDVTHFAENRIEGMREKMAAGDRHGACWHMIGNVQRRKARDVVELFDRVDAVDRIDLAEALQRRCDEADKLMPILLEVNVSGEASKHGLSAEQVGETLAAMRAFDRLRVEGLMTMAPFDATEATLRGIFGRLKRLANEHGLATMSMGMSGDYELAIEEGATEVRIGSALFE